MSQQAAAVPQMRYRAMQIIGSTKEQSISSYAVVQQLQFVFFWHNVNNWQYRPSTVKMTVWISHSQGKGKGEVNKCVRYSCQVFSGFNIQKLLRSVNYDRVTVCPQKSEPLNILQQQPQIYSDLNKILQTQDDICYKNYYIVSYKSALTLLKYEFLNNITHKSWVSIAVDDSRNSQNVNSSKRPVSSRKFSH